MNTFIISDCGINFNLPTKLRSEKLYLLCTFNDSKVRFEAEFRMAYRHISKLNSSKLFLSLSSYKYS